MRKAILAALLCAAALAACGKKEEAVVVVPPPADSITDPAQIAAATAADPATAAAAPPVAIPPNQPIRKPGLWQITSTNDRGTQTGTLCVSEATETRRAGVFATIGGPRGGQGGGQGGNRARGPGGPGGPGGEGQRPGGTGGPGGDGDRRMPDQGGQGGQGGGQGGPGGGDGERRAGGGGGGGFGGGGRAAPCTPKITKTPDGWTSTCSTSRPMGDEIVRTSTKLTLTGDMESKYTVKGAATTSGHPVAERNGTRPVSITATYKGACPAGSKPGDYKGSDGQVRNVLVRQGGGGGGQGGGQGGNR